MKITQDEFLLRRQKLMQQMQPNSIAIIFTAPECSRNGDTTYPFRPDSNFYYLTGFEEPHAVAVLIPNRAEGEFILFNQPRDKAQEIWDGFRAGQDGAVRDYQADESFAIDELNDRFPTLLKNKTALYYQFGYENTVDQQVITWKNQLQKQARSGVNMPETIINVSNLINEMRLIKSAAEISVMRMAGQINVEAHRRAMQYCTPGMSECQLYSEMAYVHLQHNCLTRAYEPIVAAGDNACILHYRAGSVELKDSELVLCDVGQEYQWYASDITRTYPVNGKFSAEQRAVYEAVLSVQMKVISVIKPGVCFDSLQQLTIRLITEKLVEIGLLHGSIDELIETKAYVDFYMHRVSHWIGLDVHDAGNYKVNDKWRKLEAGMALTIEPGIYISPSNMKVDAKWRGIGVRIEDDIVVTQTGADILTDGLPKTVSEIEALMAS